MPRGQLIVLELLNEIIDRVELAFVAYSIYELDAELAAVQLSVKVEEMNFDSASRPLERSPKTPSTKGPFEVLTQSQEDRNARRVSVS